MASRTSVRFAATRMREHQLFDRIGDFADAAHRMPQAADHLARLFRDAGFWRNLEEWYTSYVDSPWGCIDWSVAQLGTMFTSANPPGSGVRDLMANWLGAGTGVSIMRFSLAAERMVSWHGKNALDQLDEALKHADQPLYRRVTGLALHAAGATRSEIRSALGEFEENLITQRMLEDTNFKKVPVKRDFTG